MRLKRAAVSFAVDAIKPGAAFSALAAVKKPDGSFDINRINIGRSGVVPR